MVYLSTLGAYWNECSIWKGRCWLIFRNALYQNQPFGKTMTNFVKAILVTVFFFLTAPFTYRTILSIRGGNLLKYMSQIFFENWCMDPLSTNNSQTPSNSNKAKTKQKINK